MPIFIEKVNILITRLLWGNSSEEMFGNVLRLICVLIGSGAYCYVGVIIYV